jgi:hypothetical protein
MHLHHLADHQRRKLAVVAVASLVVLAALVAGGLGALGQEAAARAALGVALAGMLPVSFGAAAIFPSLGRRLQRICHGAWTAATLSSVALSRPFVRAATLPGNITR